MMRTVFSGRKECADFTSGSPGRRRVIVHKARRAGDKSSPGRLDYNAGNIRRIKPMQSFKEEFLKFAIEREVLLFGDFTTKAGRQSPYFFNAGLFNDGQSLKLLGEFYAQAILDSGVAFDGLFGPAYKGIPLAATIAVALAALGRNVPYSYNRKEAKDHGEGGALVGAPLAGRILIVDDVISAGTSVRESVELIKSAGAVPCGVSIALDRMERGLGELSAVQEVSRQHGLPVVSIVNLDDLLAYLEGKPEWVDTRAAITRYRQQYGAA
jgi:orotate phosphoribosyltransferase